MDKNASIKQSNTKKEIEAISEKIKNSRLKPSDLIIPISIGIVLIILAIFVFIPMVSSALESQKELKEIDGKMAQLKELESNVNKLEDALLTEDVLTSKKVIPKILKVSDFIYYVDFLAKEKGLSEKELSAGDTGNVETSNYSVSGPVEYAGSFEKVLEFIEEIHTSSPYLVNLKNVELSGNSNGEWTVSVDVTGFYMSDSGKSADLYSPFTPYTKYSDILETFKLKASNAQ